MKFGTPPYPDLARKTRLARIKVLALMEARVVTGPAKNILRFASDQKDQVDLTIVTFDRCPKAAPSVPAPNAFVDAARQMDIPVEIVPEEGRFDFGVVKRLAQLFNRYRPDVVQTHGVKSHLLVWLVRRKAFRWIGFHHGYTTEDLKMRAYGQFDRLSLRRCHRIITVCSPFARMLEKRGVKSALISVVPNSIRAALYAKDSQTAGSARRQFGIAVGEPVILTVGRLSPEKGHRFLIEAISLLLQSSSIPGLKVLLAGDGPLEAELRKQIESLKLSHVIQLVGHQRDIKPLFMIADLFVLPSLSEGSPNVLLESMAARLPVVATAVGGVPETVIHGESGLLVPSANAAALSAAISKLLLDRQLASSLAEAAYARARDRFSPAQYDDRILAVYQAVLNA